MKVTHKYLFELCTMIEIININMKMAKKHLDKAVLLAYDNTVRNLKNKGAFIHPLTFIGFEEQKQTVDRKVI